MWRASRSAAEARGGAVAAARGAVARVACLASRTMGNALLGNVIRHATGLEDRPPEELEAEMVEVLQDVGRLALHE